MGDVSQTSLLYKALQDRKWHSNMELVGSVYKQAGPSIARLGARIWDLKHTFGVAIEGERDPEDLRKYWYRMVPGKLHKTPGHKIRLAIAKRRNKKR